MKRILFIILLVSGIDTYSQDSRIHDHHYLNWLQTFSEIGVHKKWSIHLEYQWRRREGLGKWQQSLFRAGVNFKPGKEILFHAGYAWIETFPYGEYPPAFDGPFPEHRIYEQLVAKQPVGRWTFTHRFRIEQRWIARIRPATNREIEGWKFLHRFRYQVRMQYPLLVKGQQELYTAIADEVFVGAGKNLGTNIFDQNRIFLLAGFRFNRICSVEGGYFNQTLQQGATVNGKTVIQKNNGWLLSTLFTF